MAELHCFRSLCPHKETLINPVSYMHGKQRQAGGGTDDNTVRLMCSHNNKQSG